MRLRRMDRHSQRPLNGGRPNQHQPWLLRRRRNRQLLLLGNRRIATLMIINSQVRSSACRIATLRVVYGVILPASITRQVWALR